jgi:glutamate/tyrosine decarboxylase-like PLP-dependent enzyme
VTDPKLEFRTTLEATLQHSLEYLESLDNQPVDATVTLATLRDRLGKPLADEGIPPQQVISELVADCEGATIGSSGGRFFGFVIGGVLPAALAADWLTSVWDQSAGLYAAGPAAAVAEEICGRWLKEIFGLPSDASFALVTGCQMAHVTCLASARNALLAERGWNVEQRGLNGAPSIRILTSGERHGSIERAARLLGLGLDCIQNLATDSEGRLREDSLHEALRTDPQAPTVVILQAGDLNIGAYDAFEQLIPIARRYHAWVHVDGAFGLWAAASQRYKHLLAGVGSADSWATDGHKWLNVPYDCGYAFVARPSAHRAAMSHRAPYLTHDTDARDQIDWTPEWSRRARGFATYAALRQLGKKGIEDLIDRCCDHARALVLGMGQIPGVEVLWEPVINQGLVRFLSPDGDHDGHTGEIITAILKTGEAFFGGTTWRGQRAMRVSVCNWMTSENDVARSLAAVATAQRSISQRPTPESAFR